MTKLSYDIPVAHKSPSWWGQKIGTLSITKTGHSTGQTFGGWGHSAVKNDEGALRTFRET